MPEKRLKGILDRIVYTRVQDTTWANNVKKEEEYSYTCEIRILEIKVGKGKIVKVKFGGSMVYPYSIGHKVIYRSWTDKKTEGNCFIRVINEELVDLDLHQAYGHESRDWHESIDSRPR